MEPPILEAVATEPPVDTSCFDSREFLPAGTVDLSALWSYAVESSEPSPQEAEVVMESSEDSDGSPLQANSGAVSEQEQHFVQMVNELNVMVAATIPGSPLAAASPSSPASGSSSSFEPEYQPPARGKRNKPASARNTKKARKAKTPTAASPNSVELTEDELLVWSSEDYNHHVSTIAEKRRLTDREQQIVKDQKRRIKNRESAQESRERRRAQLEQLQEEVTELKSEKAELAEENARLREQVARLQGTVRQFDSVRAMWTSWTSSGRKGVNNNAVKAAGMCLLVVLFSFGLLFNQHKSVTGPRISLFDRTPSIEAKLLRNNLVNAAVGNPTAAATESSQSYSVSARQRSLLWSENATPSVEEIDTKEIPAARSRSPLALEVIAKETRTDMETSQAVVHGQDLAVGNKANLSESYQRFASNNVTFLMCTELGKAVPAAPEGQSFKGEPFVIAFLPEDPTRDMSEQTHVMQLTCRLLDVTRAEVRHEVAPTTATPVVLSAVPNFS